MASIDLKLWTSYRLGKVNRDLTEKEIIEIENSELASLILVPKKSFENLYLQLKKESWRKEQIIRILTNSFKVPEEIILIRIYEYEKDRLKSEIETSKQI